jgi:hypothetical protein
LSYTSCAADDANDDSAGINAAITDASRTGGVVLFPSGVDCRIQHPIIVKDGTILQGPGNVDGHSDIRLRTPARIQPAVDLPALITSDDPSINTFGVIITGLNLDGRKDDQNSPKKVEKLIHVAFLSSQITSNVIGDGSGTCIYWQQQYQWPSWLNIISHNRLGNCSEWGIVAEGSDSEISGNVISGDGTGDLLLANINGAVRVTNNQIEKGPVGIMIQNDIPSLPNLPITDGYDYIITSNTLSEHDTAVYFRNPNLPVENPIVDRVVLNDNLFSNNRLQSIRVDFAVIGGQVEGGNIFRAPHDIDIQFDDPFAPGSDYHNSWRVCAHRAGVEGPIRILNPPSDLDRCGIQ